MTEKHYRHLPIIDDSGYVSGIMDVAQLLQVRFEVAVMVIAAPVS